MTSVTNGMNEITVDIPESAFAAPAHSRDALEGALRRALDTIVEKRFRHARHVLPALAMITKDTWSGAEKPVRDEIERYRTDAETTTAALIDAAEARLCQARIGEQTLGAVARSQLYVALSASFAATLTAEWEPELAGVLKSLKKPDEDFQKKLHATLWHFGLAASYDTLIAKSEDVLGEGRKLVDDRCQRMLHGRIAAYVAQRLTNMRNARGLLVEASSDAPRVEARRLAVDGTAIARGATAAAHDASIPPARNIIEQEALSASSFASKGKIRLEAFWSAFGAWASARGELPAEEPSGENGSPLAGSIAVFLHEHAERTFGALTLGDLYARTGATVPIADLQERARIPVDLLHVANLVPQGGQREVRSAVVPANLGGVHLAPGWLRSEAHDPNRLKLLQDFKGFSARAVLGLERPEWQAALDVEAIAHESSTPMLSDVVTRRGVVQRLRGEPLSQPHDAPAPAVGVAPTPDGPSFGVVAGAPDCDEDLSAAERRLVSAVTHVGSSNGAAPAASKE